MLTVLTVIGVALLVLWLAQRSFIYFPESTLPAPASVGLARVELVSFKTEDDLDLDAWWVPAARTPSDRTIVVFNGNAGNRAYRAPLAALFSELGYSTLLTDYRGYGGNPGLPSERGLERDARGALKYLATRADVDLSRVVYFGESLGAAVAVRLAEEYPPAALILRSPFTSLAAMGAVHYPFLPARWILKDRFASIDRIARIRSPILFLAGDEDRIIPFSDSELLFEAAGEPKRLIAIRGADHNDEALVWGPEVIAAIRTFLD